MAQEITNFSRFYTLFNQLPYEGDREDFKSELVRNYTWNRTDSLREMTRDEYNALCTDLERMTGYRDEQKKLRSECLKLMQKTGVDTTDWTRINSLCMDKRIAGKPFARLTNDELKALAKKLRGIERKGGFRPKREEVKKRESVVCIVPMSGNIASS